ncbi:MAG TPA: Asp-tRNA(Asn)/Glu-tRNA(Gln) amidotransferase subunit GatC [Gemmatimonadaceae bacterium]|nr:Asp-tRNA(Asn)/Glu-tRNA(Gln) amidotransferase subunit GatC [Gemmatimonadaceae bacterium]
MAVTQDDVRHVAELARLAVDESRLDSLVRELNGILEHMEVLAEVETGDASDDTSYTGLTPTSTPLREDSSGPIPLNRPIESFAPATRNGFILVPRLASHADEISE